MHFRRAPATLAIGIALSSGLALLGILSLGTSAFGQDTPQDDATSHPGTIVSDQAIGEALERSGENRVEIQAALDRAPAEQLRGMRFLVANMPQRDLTSLSADFLLENTSYAYRAWNEAPWKERLPEDVFLNDVLPYACINERRDAWRADFYSRFKPLVAQASSPGEAAVRLNQQIFNILNVRYSTRRNRADQGPYESINSGLASCTGLSILLIDACRAVGVPARFVGTPLWSDRSGNHSWVEVWDNGWHFTGAAEPSGDRLDEAWFTARASTAQPGHPRHGIFAVSFRRTPLIFPMVWARRDQSVYAVEVTERYAGKEEPLPEGLVQMQFRVVDPSTGDRCAASLSVWDATGRLVFQGQTKDERYDRNDHLIAALAEGGRFTVQAHLGTRGGSAEISAARDGDLVTIRLTAAQPAEEQKETDAEVPAESGSPNDSSSALEALRRFLDDAPLDAELLAQQPFASVPLTSDDARQAAISLWESYAERERAARAEEMAAKEVTYGTWKMPFYYRTFGEKPEGGWSLYLSLHGGGQTRSTVNDRQWENQKRLYELTEGVYLAPRAPTDTWNMWHQDHVDPLFERLIQNMVLFEGVNPDRVYLMGYSAGGDGVYQVAPRMADRFAAASMMAGHPNEASPLGLRNLPFSIQVGGLDSAYNRNQVAEEWGQKLDKLQQADPKGYEHWVKIYPDKRHWMDGEDAVAVGWMHRFQRNCHPERIVWYQDDVVRQRFYWLAVDVDAAQQGHEVIAERDGQTIRIVTSDAPRLHIRLSDEVVDMDQPIEVRFGERTLFEGRVPRTIQQLARTLEERGDPRLMFSGEVTVEIPELELKELGAGG